MARPARSKASRASIRTLLANFPDCAMSHWSRKIPFKVDVAGVIHVMGSALYSRPEAAIRELIQNAHDAVVRRRRREISFRGRIDILQDVGRHALEFRDDGIGLSAEEAEQFLGTLGIGITRLIKGEDASAGRNGDSMIGQFGIGLFSAFMLADRLVVESLRSDQPQGIRWSAGAGTDIDLESCEYPSPGTTVTLHLKPEHYWLAEDRERLEQVVKEYADFLPVPIFIGESAARANVVYSAWFDPTPDREAIELELSSYFAEAPF